MPLLETGLPDLLYRGKVRDTDDWGERLMLMVATDRISAFDVVLPNGIPDKGYVLSRMSKFWFDLTKHIVPNHFVALADDPEGLGELADHPLIKDLPKELARQASVVKRAKRIDVECVVRAYLTGTALVDYKKTATIFGIPAPAAGSGDRMGLDRPVLHPDQHLRRSPHDMGIVERKVVHVRRWIHGPQRAIHIERMNRGPP